VDDEPANLLALRAVLEDLCPNLVEARSGEEALRRLREADYAAVLLDVQMRGLDGFETAQLIRAQERSCHTPVIFLTAYEDNRLSVEQAYALGAVDYLVKPLVPNILRAKVAGFVELYRKTEEVNRQGERLRALERQQAQQALAESEARNAAVLAAALDGIITIDQDGKVIEFNPAAERIFGYRGADVLGREMGELLIPPTLRQSHRRGLARYLATGEGPVLGQRIEMPALRSNGTQFQVELAITRLPTSGPPVFTAFVREISERKRAEQQRATKLAVAQLLAQAATAEAALDGILQAVCESLEWEVGAIWEVDRQVHGLRCVRFWHAPTALVPDFEAASRQITFAPGVGLPGRVWTSGKPAWIADVVSDANFPRAPLAAKDGLHGAFGFPLRLGRETIGVIEFFSKAVQEPDEDLLEMMATVGAHIGQFLDRKRAEEEIRTLNAQMQARLDEMNTLLEILPTGVWIGNADCSQITGNPAAYQIMGLTPGINVSVTNPEPEVPAGLRIFVNGAEVSPQDAPMQQVGRAGQPWHNFEHELLFPDGTRKIIYGSAAPLFDQHGAVRKVIGAYADFTERKRAEEERLASEQRFTRFMEHLPGLAWIKDLDGRYVYVNDAAEKAFRKARADLYGKNDDDVFPSQTAAQFKENDRRALASGTGIQTIETLEHDDGVLHHSIVSKFPISGPDGKVALVGGIAIDINDRMRAEEALRDADRRKDEFLATLAHELRNPLAPIRNALQLLRLAGTDALMINQAGGMLERQVLQMVRLRREPQLS
jgi:PAS domain S-box-containing protein